MPAVIDDLNIKLTLDIQGIPANSLQAIANSIQTSVNSLKSSYPTATITPNMDVNVQVDVS